MVLTYGYMLDLPAPVRTVDVNNWSELLTALANAQTDDYIRIADGSTNNGSVQNLTTPAACKRVVIQARNKMGHILQGSPVNLNGTNMILHGFDLRYSVTGDFTVINGPGARISRCKFNPVNNGDSLWLNIKNGGFLLDHCEFGPKTTAAAFYVVSTSTTLYPCARFILNYFHDHTGGAGNGAESGRVGNSSMAWMEFNAEFAYNRYENLSTTDTEFVTNKGSKIWHHHNTYVNCNSSLSLRHGNMQRIEDCVFENTGFRMNGHWHRIVRNQWINVGHNQLRAPTLFQAGADIDDSPGTGQSNNYNQLGASNARYSQVFEVTYENNIIMNGNARNDIILGLGYQTQVTPTQTPERNRIRNNIVSASTGQLTGRFNTAQGVDWNKNIVEGNILWPTGSATIGDMPAGGYSQVDPKLVLGPDGHTYVFSVDSPLKWDQTIKYLTAADVGINAP